MKNKKYIWIGTFVLSVLFLTYSYKDIKLYYYVKMGNKNYYSKNYEKAIEYYEKALKIKEDYNIRINLIITDYQMKNYKKVLESPVEDGFLKGNSLVFMSEKNQNNTEDLKKSLEYYKEEILTNNDINIKKNYEIIENRLKEQQQNQDNNQQENKDKKQNQNSDSEKDKNNNDNQQNNQSQDSKNQQNNNDNQQQDNKDSQNNDKQNQNQNNKENSNKNNQPNQNSNNNQNNLDRNNNERNNSQENLDNSNKEKSKNSDQEKNQNSNSENNKNSNSQNSPMDKPQQTKHQKKLQLMLKNLEKNEKQSFKNNERLIGVENESDTKNRW